MDVFVMETGCIYEGGGVDGVYESERAARIAADAHIAYLADEYHEGGEWAPRHLHGNDVFRLVNVDIQQFVRVRRMTVQGLPACMVA